MAGGATIYRYVDSNQLKVYPNSTVAASWDPNWSNPTTIDWKGLQRGPDMVAK